MNGTIRIAKNSLLITISRVTEMISSLVITGLLSRYLGLEDFGNYLFIMAIILTTTSFAHMGIPQILVREISQNKPLTANLIQSGLFLTAIILVIVGVVLFPITLFLKFTPLLLVALWLAFFSEAMVLFSGPFISAFISFEKMEYDAEITIINRLLLLLLLLCVIYLDLGFMFIFATLTIANLLRLLAVISISNRKIIRVSYRLWGTGAKRLFMESLPLGISFILIQLYLHSNLFILKGLKDAKEVALFQGPFSIISKLQILPTILIVAFAPVMARLAIKGAPYVSLRNVYMCINKYLFIFCLPFSLAGVFMAKRITTIILGADFIQASVSFQILIWIINLSFLNIFSDKVLTVIGKQKLLMISSVVSFLANLLLGFFFVTYYGYVGASIAALCSSIILFGLNFYFVSLYVKHTSLFFVVKPLLAVSVATLFLIWFNRLYEIGFMVICFILYCGLLFILRAYSKDELKLFMKTINESDV